MKETFIGDTRTFDRYEGTWTITKINKDSNLTKELRLKDPRYPLPKCPHCGGILTEKKKYTFNYVETLENDGKSLHLGVSDCGRYVILEEHGGV